MSGEAILVLLAENQRPDGLTCSVREDDCASYLLVGVTGIDSEADVSLDGLVKPCLGVRRGESDCLLGIVELLPVDGLERIDIFLSMFHLIYLL